MSTNEVLIPSKSGLGCYRRTSTTHGGCIRLNPFEIRAGLLPRSCASIRFRLSRLNPFEIRAGLLQSSRTYDSVLGKCLNPFEIRAGLLRELIDGYGGIAVLIPSKSGLGCYS